MKILAIETSCDETAIALIEAKGGVNPSAGSGPFIKILKNLVASQIKIHRPFGGVVPNLAKREHLKNLPILLNKICGNNIIFNSKFKIQKSKSQIKIQNFLKIIDLIAVTVGPGLEPALWTGINFSKKIKNQKSKIKIIGVNHLEGHLYSFLLKKKIGALNVKGQMSKVFPAIALLVSGGHTILIKMDSLEKYKKIGETRDDAVGEAFDKVARLLNLSYPGGPEIEKLAKYGSSTSIDFPRPMINQKNYDFSFSGLKTAVLYYLRDLNLKPKTPALPAGRQNLKPDIAASFQQAAFDVLISKTLRAAREFKAKSIFISGGVAANNSLRNYLKSKIKNQNSKLNIFFPEKKFCGDNAVMIAVAGYINYLKKKNRRLTANGNLGI